MSEREPSLWDALEAQERAAESAEPAESKGAGKAPDTPADTSEPPPEAKKKAPAGRRRATPRRRPDSDEQSDGEPGARPAAEAEAPVLTVAQLTRRISERVQGLGRVRVEGEISRVSRAASGHVYFDLKDLDAKVACVVWRSNVQSALRFDLREGQQVVAHGRLDVYAPRGSYSLNVQRLEQAGIGALLQQLEELKRELKRRGWFDRARPLPTLPAIIGVVTSRDGAAFQDFLRTRSVRWPGYPVRLAHAPVQGPGASRELAQAIGRLDASGVDMIVVCRGGGSLEDLWAFNELPVAEAIWRASVPVISGVGHETDVTLADLVADLRAHTPTDAAQTAVPDRRRYLERLEAAHNYLLQALDRSVEERARALERLGRSRFLRDPAWILGRRADELAALQGRLRQAALLRGQHAKERVDQAHRRLERASPRARLDQQMMRLRALEPRLGPAALKLLERREHRAALLAEQLEARSPLRILARGYSITQGGDPARALRDADQVRVGDELRTRLARGELVSRVTSVRPSEDESEAERSERD